MKNVSDILSKKGNTIYSVKPTDTVFDALKLMSEKDIGSVVVMLNDKYFGLLTERDYARKVILKSKTSAETKVQEIMSIDLPKVTSETSLEICRRLLSERNIRYLPVFENEKITGIISVNDLIKAEISDQKATIEQLESYIHSGM